MRLEEFKKTNEIIQHEIERKATINDFGETLLDEFVKNGIDIRNTFTKMNEKITDILMQDEGLEVEDEPLRNEAHRENCCVLF